MADPLAQFLRLGTAHPPPKTGPSAPTALPRFPRRRLRYADRPPKSSAVYGAIPDRNWGCRAGEDLRPDLRSQIILSASYAFTHRQDDIHFVWQATTGPGTPPFHRRRARAAFLRNRIGWCVLHHPGMRRRPLSRDHPDGSARDLVFPKSSPRKPVEGLRNCGLAHEIRPGLGPNPFRGRSLRDRGPAQLIDASFKTCGLPSPAVPGQFRRHSNPPVVELRLIDLPTASIATGLHSLRPTRPPTWTSHGATKGPRLPDLEPTLSGIRWRRPKSNGCGIVVTHLRVDVSLGERIDSRPMSRPAMR
jgi:hypothetical protein